MLEGHDLSHGSATEHPVENEGEAKGVELGLNRKDIRAAIAKAKAWIADLPPTLFDGREDEPLTYTIGTGMTLTLPNGQWITGFATTNLYFHLSTAYGILRSRGAPIGKVDLFAGGL